MPIFPFDDEKEFSKEAEAPRYRQKPGMKLLSKNEGTEIFMVIGQGDLFVIRQSWLSYSLTVFVVNNTARAPAYIKSDVFDPSTKIDLLVKQKIVFIKNSNFFSIFSTSDRKNRKICL